MLSLSMSWPFNQASISPVSIIGKYHAALNGRPYILDLNRAFPQMPFRHYSVQQLRQQQDTSPSPSEASLNPEGLWRRSFDTWHFGAGQSFVDRTQSDTTRFNTSKGVDPWTKWQLSLLNDTSKKLTSANTNLPLVAAGAYLYVGDGQVLKYATDVTVGSPFGTTVTGTDTSTIQSMCSDGHTVWLAQAAGVYSTNRGDATASSYTALTNQTLIRYVNGRLMSSAANVIYNITGSGAPPAAFFTHDNTDFKWVDFTDGQTSIYAAGYSGDKSIIYRIPIKTDGTGLDVPMVAGLLPDGEIVRSLQSYLGFVVAGSDKGVRLAQADSQGNLTFGSLIPTSSAVGCFEPQDRFVWYGLTNYDATSTGLGRLDLSVETAALTPAYASDLMATAQGAVLSVASFQNRRCFAVSGTGVYVEQTTPVASGTWQSGQITYKLPDNKVVMFVDVRHDLIGQHSAAVSVNGGAFSSIGTHTTDDSPFQVGERRAYRTEVQLTLTAVANVSPVIRSLTMRAYPAAASTQLIDAPIILAEEITLLNGSVVSVDVTAEREAIKEMHANQELVIWQEGDFTISIVVSDYEWRHTHMTKDKRAWNGTMLVTLKEI